MRPIRRRSFLKSGLSIAAVAGSGLTASCLRPPLTVTTSSHTALIIGSGFGGSVAALRLGEAGIDTLLLERGRAWSPGAAHDGFPRTLDLARGDGRTAWLSHHDSLSGLNLPVTKYAGLLERVEGPDMAAVCGAGLGGGSLVYASVLMRPSRNLFESTFPLIDYDTMVSTFYPRVLAQLSGGTIPDDLLNDTHFAAMREFLAGAHGTGVTLRSTNIGFDWNIVHDELEGRVPHAALAGDYIFGCNSGAKNSLDKNYLAAATATGKVEIRTLHEADVIRECDDGSFEADCNVIDEFGTVLGRHTARARYLFLAAGSLNTCKLLLRAKQRGTLSGLNDQVGKHWGTNGDELCIRIGTNTTGVTQGGPAFVTGFDANNSIAPVGLVCAPMPVIDAANTQFVLGMSRDDTLGEITYDAATDRTRLDWSASANQLSAQARRETLQKLAASGATQTRFLFDMLPPSTWHPLGGMVMGEACDTVGQVLGQRNLFVVDGALLPGYAAGCAPSLTIAANAERILQHLLDDAVVHA